MGPLCSKRPTPAGGALFGLRLASAWNGDVPPGVQPLPVDISRRRTSTRTATLWTDPRYFRCNSPDGLEMQRGAIFTATIGKDPPRTAAWGYCDRDYPREAIVSPYRFKTAQEHYEALLAETRKRGGPDEAHFRDGARRDQRPLRARQRHSTTGTRDAVEQIPTVLSLLTPEYQTRMVQQAYHQGEHQRAAVAVAVLLAGRVHAALVLRSRSSFRRP